MVHEHDPEPRHYYDWMLWKLRQETMEQDDPTDDITKTGGRLSAWTERPHMSKEDMYMKEIALMQESNHKLLIRVKELGEEINRLKEKMDANL
tara:strand:- start:325 stop:603 length:279 start_codon:yes stop_codon:yes gene_type:complete